MKVTGKAFKRVYCGFFKLFLKILNNFVVSKILIGKNAFKKSKEFIYFHFLNFFKQFIYKTRTFQEQSAVVNHFSIRKICHFQQKINPLSCNSFKFIPNVLKRIIEMI
jgi:hypothetical protein